MRSISAETKPATAAANGEGQPGDITTLLDAMLDRISAERVACEKLGDAELAQRAGRNVLTAVSCAADAVLGDAGTLHSAPDKVGAFFDKAAAGFVQAIDGLHKRAALMDVTRESAPGGARVDPRQSDYAMWGPLKTS
jgi:hypothetical protein